MVSRILLLVLATLLLGACALEHEVLAPALDEGHVVLPEPKDTVLVGQATGLAGGEVRYLGPGANALPGQVSALDSEGLFEQHFAGTTEHAGLVLVASEGQRSAAGLLPLLPRQPTVFHEERLITLWEQHPSLADLGVDSTTVALTVIAAARLVGLQAAALPPEAISEALDQAWAALLDEDSDVHVLGRMIATLDAALPPPGVGSWLDVTGYVGGGSALAPAWLTGTDVDYDGDEILDTSSAVFDAQLSAAAAGIDVGVCFPEDRIRVVFHLTLGKGAVDGNCSVVNPYKWAVPSAGKGVFFTGGIHEDVPRCTEERVDHCLSEAEIDDAHDLLGGWVPNEVSMYDDGTHGDVAADDGIWTATFDLPYIATAASEDGAGVRVGYKYTLGHAGDGWTSTEEWPGNQRLLELEDLNGDHIVVREDVFGDEASNKDKANALKPVFGGCGAVAWEADKDPDCAGDTREAAVDLDGDCAPDVWPSPGLVAPLTEACGGSDDASE